MMKDRRSNTKLSGYIASANRICSNSKASQAPPVIDSWQNNSDNKLTCGRHETVSNTHYGLRHLSSMWGRKCTQQIMVICWFWQYACVQLSLVLLGQSTPKINLCEVYCDLH